MASMGLRLARPVSSSHFHKARRLVTRRRTVRASAPARATSLR
jgi:hypothetical protein